MPANAFVVVNASLVEAAGVELFSVLITRKLLIPGTATTAKKAPLPDPLYVYCTKMLFGLESHRQDITATVSHRFADTDRKKRTQIPTAPQVPFSTFSFRR